MIIAGAAAYFVGHFAYLTPYEALYPDLVPAIQGDDAMWFVIGPAVLAAGPLLLWQRRRTPR